MWQAPPWWPPRPPPVRLRTRGRPEDESSGEDAQPARPAANVKIRSRETRRFMGGSFLSQRGSQQRLADIFPSDIHHRRELPAEAPAQRLRSVRYFIIHLFLIKRNHLIKPDTASVRKGTGCGFLPKGHGIFQQHAAQTSVLRKRLAAGHRMPPAQPGFSLPAGGP